MSSVQFYGVAAALEAYENMNVPAFSIKQGSNFLFKYDGTGPDGDDQAPTMDEGAQILGAYLRSLHAGRATYTLRVHEDHQPGDKLRPNSPYTASFGFRLQADEPASPAASLAGAASLPATLERITARLEALERADQEEDDEDDLAPEGVSGVLLGLMQEPEKLAQLINIGRALFSGIRPPALGQVNQETGYPAYHGPDYVGGEYASQTSEAATEWDRVARAVQTMQAADPDIIAHLEKLATVAATDRPKFIGLVKMLALL